MCATTGAMPLSSTACRKVDAASAVRGFVFQLRGLQVNIWQVLQVRSCARGMACARDPAMETWHPMLIMAVRNASASGRQKGWHVGGRGPPDVELEE
ncbi:hypothetical protein JCM10550A_00370 [Methanogenium cariaci]